MNQLCTQPRLPTNKPDQLSQKCIMCLNIVQGLQLFPIAHSVYQLNIATYKISNKCSCVVKNTCD